MGGSRLYENEKTFQCVGAGVREGWWVGVRACVRARAPACVRAGGHAFALVSDVLSWSWLTRTSEPVSGAASQEETSSLANFHL